MAQLEGQTKPILIGLMERTMMLDSLNDEQRRLLARWIGKTAIIESYAIGAEKPIDSQLLHAMRQYEEGPPGRFGVLGLLHLNAEFLKLRGKPRRSLRSGVVLAPEILLDVILQVRIHDLRGQFRIGARDLPIERELVCLGQPLVPVDL